MSDIIGVFSINDPEEVKQFFADKGHVSAVNDIIDSFSINDPEEVKQFFAEQGRISADNYIRRHNITRPPKDEAEALEWAQRATAEYFSGLLD